MCASIDKTYLSYDKYLELKDWCKNTELIYDNGIKGSPKDFLYSYIEPYEGELPVWNTPEAFNRWLFFNCPLPFIQERLKEQYINPESYFTRPITYKPRGRHYTILNKPKINYRYKYTWFIDIVYTPLKDGLYYGFNSKIWYSYNMLMPPESRAFYHCTIRNLTKRRLNQLISKWGLPIGTILSIYNKYIGSEYKIKIKR